MKTIVPDDIVKCLQLLEDKKELSEAQREKLDTWLSGLESAVVNPVCESKILVNPVPKEPDVSLNPERSLEDRIRHINTVSARVNAMMRPESPEEAEDFDIDDPFDMGAPRSIFEVRDHFVDMIPEELEPISPSKESPESGSVSSKSEADVSTASETVSPGAEQ